MNALFATTTAEQVLQLGTRAAIVEAESERHEPALVR